MVKMKEMIIKIKNIFLPRIAFCISTFLLMASQASAHEKWFHETEGYGLRWDLFFRPLPLAFVAAVWLATLAGWFFWRAPSQRGFVPGPEHFGTTNERRMALYGLVPLIVGVHVAVPLFVWGRRLLGDA